MYYILRPTSKINLCKVFIYYREFIKYPKPLSVSSSVIFISSLNSCSEFYKFFYSNNLPTLIKILSVALKLGYSHFKAFKFLRDFRSLMNYIILISFEPRTNSIFSIVYFKLFSWDRIFPKCSSMLKSFVYILILFNY